LSALTNPSQRRHLIVSRHLDIQLKSCAESKLGRGSASRVAVILRELLFRKFCLFQ
jgi:hypothetical protein